MRTFVTALTLLTLLAAGRLSLAAEVLVTLSTRPQVTQSFIFEAPDAPQASLILFAGNAGALALSDLNGAPRIGGLRGNFLVRSRHDFVRAGFAVATVDAPSDQRTGMTTAFRVGRDHALDIAAVAAWLGQKAPAPVWLVGTSQGTVSAASLAGYIGHFVDGLVLTSSVIHEGGRSGGVAPDGVLSLDLTRITVPVLVLAHAGDRCVASPPEGARTIDRRLVKSPRHTSALIRGGSPPQSDACEAFSAHGYFGVEDDALARIAAFIKGE